MQRSSAVATRSANSLFRVPGISVLARVPRASSSKLSTLAKPRSLVSRSSTAVVTPFQRGLATVSDHTESPIDEETIEQEPEEEEIERAEDDVDVCIVGGGPAGLAAAIRLKQLEAEHGREIRVVVLEKGGEVGSHILSGAVVEPRALNELFPNWSDMENPPPMGQPAMEDSMKFLTATGTYPLPHPPQMSNKGNYILSLSRLTAWLGEQAEELGVEVYAGFAGAALVLGEDGKSVRGVRTGDVGLDRQGKQKDSFEPGMQFNSKCLLIAEGAHGSLSQIVQKKFNLRESSSINDKIDPQTYGLGIKEVWKVAPEKHVPGKVTHTLGWPLDFKTYGGSWCYHMEGGLVSLGLVVGLDYENPHLSPYKEFQRMKHHPVFADLLEGGECIAYGARALNEGGLQSIPKLHFPGGALIGCSAGFLNVPKIKGTHNAMKSGMLAAETAYKALHPDVPETLTKNSLNEELEGSAQEAADMSAYETAVKDSWIYSELNEVRNLRPSFHNPLGLWGGMLYSGIDSLILKGRTPWTLRTKIEDYAATKKGSEMPKIEYPAPDGKLSFDILTSVSLTGTNHAEDQPVHLRLPKEDGAKARHVETNVNEYAGLLGRVCPAAVYEYQDAEGGVEDAAGKKFVINSQNCIHCKTCSIKTPTQDITWCVPEGGGGPKYNIT